jgi:anti-sigma B factor antagonist
MALANINIKIREIDTITSVLDIQGEINAFAEKDLMTAYGQVSERGAQTIILNFEKLEYMNSSGIGLLITLLIRCNRQKQRLLAINLKDHYQQIFELTRLNEAIQIYSNEAEALAAL